MILSYAELVERRDSFDRAVRSTRGIDQFCSSSAWAFSAFEALSPGHAAYAIEGPGGYAALAEGWHERLGRYRQPLEASWGLASPFVGADQAGVVAAFCAACLKESDRWDLLFLSGLEPGGAAYRGLLVGFGRARGRLGVGPPATRYVASLGGGLEAFLARRGAKFRANARRARRRARDRGFQIDYVGQGSDVSALRVLERAVEVEERSWKGQTDTGLTDAHMRAFYAHMLPRLARTGALRALFLREQGRDVAFVFGGVLGSLYRGLQVSFDDDYAKMSLGNVCQIEIIERLCEEGIERYDLGSEIEYKRAWAEERFETVSIIVRRS